MLRYLRCCLAAMTLLLFVAPSYALTFQFVDGTTMTALKRSNPSLYTQIRAAVEAAGREWSQRITTPVTITVSVDWQNLGTPIASSSMPYSNTIYSTYRTKLAATANPYSATDATALRALPAVNAMQYVVRNPGVSYYGSYLTAPVALFKGMGLVRTAAGFWDGSLFINSTKKFDFNPADGITANQYDLVGILSHEIGHILGAVSTVDAIDSNPRGTFYPSVLDLFRWSLDARGYPVRDLSADTVPKFFSLNGAGGHDLHRGVRLGGTKQQACHWLSMNTGLMAAQAATGTRYPIQQADLTLMDAIGWNLATN